MWLIGWLLVGAVASADEAGFSVGDSVVVVNAVDSKRFEGSEDKGPALEANAAAQVVYVSGDQVRVMVRGTSQFGWVSAGDLKAAKAEMDLDSLLKSLGQPKAGAQ